MRLNIRGMVKPTKMVVVVRVIDRLIKVKVSALSTDQAEKMVSHKLGNHDCQIMNVVKEK